MVSTSIFVSNTSIISRPYGIAFDSYGNLYCANINSQAISKVTSTGIVSTFALGAGPIGLAIDNNNNVYFSNLYNQSIVKKTASLISTYFATSMLSPFGLAIDALGNVYCSNGNRMSISKITPDGTVSTFANIFNGLSSPVGLAFDASGNLYCANSGNNTISKITSSGIASTFVASNKGLSKPTGLACDQYGNLYCTNLDINTISKITSSGIVSTVVSDLSGPAGLAFDTFGDLYCSNSTNDTIVKIILRVTPTLSNFSIPEKTYGSEPFQIIPPTSNSDGAFSYTSSNLLVATINGSAVTIVSPGTSVITATQSVTEFYTSGSITNLLTVTENSAINPVQITTSEALLYFLNSSSIYCELSNNVVLDKPLTASVNSKVLVNGTSLSIKITRT